MLFPGSVYFGYNIQEYLFGGLITPPPPSSLALDLLALFFSYYSPVTMWNVMYPGIW